MRMWTSTAAALVLIVGLATRAEGQGWIKPQCDLNTSHFLVNSAKIYLQTAARGSSERDRHLRDADRVLHQAVDQGQAENGSLWYLFARYYVYRDDLDGADSAFALAEQLLPDCREDIQAQRRNLWVPILNRGVDAIQADDTETAKAIFRRANSIYQGEPHGFYYLANIFVSDGQTDSAMTYYERAFEKAEAEEDMEIRETSAFNIARLQHQRRNWDAAEQWYQRYRETDPEDPEAIVGLAAVYNSKAAELEAAGEPDSAAQVKDQAIALYDTVLVKAPSMSATDLFATGVTLYEAERYQQAAQAFLLGLEKNPYFRDGLFNLANTYLTIGRTIPDSATPEEKKEIQQEAGGLLLPVARQLVELDPYSTASRRMVAAAFQLLTMPDSTLAALEAIENLPFEVQVMVFQPRGGQVLFGGSITNRTEEAISVPEITFEFVNEEGEVIDSYLLEGQTLEGDGYTEFNYTASGDDIRAWRYRVATS